MVLRAVVFDLDGVLALPSLFSALDRVAEELVLPSGFLNKAFNKEGLGGSTVRLMRGEITYCQWVSLMEGDYRKYSEESGICLPKNFSINQIFGKALSAKEINRPMLQAALTLRKKGFTTGILTNNYLDDSTQRGQLAQLMGELRPHFDFLIESCRIGMAKPDPQIYRFMLDTLKASPNEVVFLDDVGANLKPARDLGVVTILARNTNTALQELEKVTGMQLLETAAPLPIPCKPSDMSHGYVPIKPGVHLHFVELGSGPPVCLCHGFPESWYSWRYQIPALAQAGFRVLAVDMKGYGESSAPPEIEEYSMEVLCKDMVTFLDKLGISQAVFIGHDWGGMLVWNMALFYPERVRAVASLNTPFIPANPKVSQMEALKANPIFDYQLYFQEPGVAEAELEQNLNRTFKAFFRASDEVFLSTKNVREAGGLLVRTPENPSPSKLLTEEDIQFYVQQFKKSGFRGPLNWYRNIDKNWKWSCKSVGRKILIPALMVVAEKDKVLLPEMTKHMEDWVHGYKGVTFHNWAETYGCSPEMYYQPTSVEEIREVLALARQQNKRVKVVGGGHSPSDIACTDGFMIHMGKMNRILQVDTEKKQVTVEAGILLADLNPQLDKHGLALSNLGAVSDVTAAGVIGSGTHNTGIKHGILATQVVALTLLTADGTMLECSESHNARVFQAVRVHLGCLGVILTITLQCVPQFHLQETSFPSTLREVLDNLDSHLKKSEYFRFLWFPHSENVSVIYQDHTNKPPSSSSNWFWDYAIGFYLLEFLLWISTFLPGLVGWINRFFFWLLFTRKKESSNLSYKIFTYECRFKQHVQDWAIPREKTKEALLELKAVLEAHPKVVAHFPVEVRFSRGDDILLSPCFQRDSCYMNIIMYRPYGKDVSRLDYWLAYETIMKKVGGRPHWAKAHNCTRKDFEKMYPAFPKFCAIREQLDPTGMFLNAYLEKVFY